jgi:hypothetical protein
MGGGSSKQGSLASPQSGANGRGTNNRRPSSIYTVPEEEDSDDDCLNCSFLGGFCPPQKKKTYDPMGTPVPDTPVVSRKQRKMFENAIDDDNGSNNNTNNGVSPSSRTGLFSSRYFGLEKEEDSSSILDTEEEEEPHDENAPAQIHEGPVSHFLVFIFMYDHKSLHYLLLHCLPFSCFTCFLNANLSSHVSLDS